MEKLNIILSWLWEYRFMFMLGIWVITSALANWTKFKLDLNKGMLAAKQLAKEQVLKSGQEQMEWVIKYAYDKLPRSWVTFLGEARTRQLIQKLYNSALDLIDDGKLNDSIGK